MQDKAKDGGWMYEAFLDIVMEDMPIDWDKLYEKYPQMKLLLDPSLKEALSKNDTLRRTGTVESGS